MRPGNLVRAVQIATVLAVTVGWLFVFAVVDRPPAVPVAHAGTGTFANSTSSAIPGMGTSGLASPHLSTINVSGLMGTVTKATVTIDGYSHGFPDDVDVLLVGPTSSTVVLMSDVGGTNAVNVIPFSRDCAV